MKKASEIKRKYDHYLISAAKFHIRDGATSAMFSFTEGMLQGYGDVLGYDSQQIEKDIQSAVERLTLDKEATNA